MGDAQGDIPWTEFSLWKKVYHWISLAIRGSFIGIILGVLIYGVVEKWLNLGLNLTIYSFFGIGITIVIIIMIVYNQKSIKIIEERCKNKEWNF